MAPVCTFCTGGETAAQRLAADLGPPAERQVRSVLPLGLSMSGRLPGRLACFDEIRCCLPQLVRAVHLATPDGRENVIDDRGGVAVRKCPVGDKAAVEGGPY